MFPWGARSKPSESRPTEPAVLGFGKTSALPEYVRAGPATPIASAIEEWFVAATEWGAHHRGPRWKAEFDSGLPQRFLFHAPGEPSLLVAGVAIPSHDSVGRRFPLVVYALVPSSPLATVPQLAPQVFRGFFEEASAVLRSLTLCRSASDFAQRISSVALPAVGSALRYEKEWHDWTTDIFGFELFADLYSDLAVESAGRALHTILDAVSPFVGTESPPTSLGLRLPLSPRDPAMSASFWIEAIRICAGWKQNIPVWFSPAPPSSRSILVQLGDQPPSSVIADLWMPDPAADQVCDLTTPHLLDASSLTVRMPPILGAIVEDPGASVANVLAALRS